MRTLAICLLLVLAACGGGSDDEPPATRTTAPVTEPAASPTVASPTGTPAPEALSRFRCEERKPGRWSASGYLANQTKGAVTYQVTVYVGEASGAAEKAKTRQVPNVGAGGSVQFRLNGVPAPRDGGPCHVQVLAQR